MASDDIAGMDAALQTEIDALTSSVNFQKILKVHRAITVLEYGLLASVGALALVGILVLLVAA